MSTQIESQSYEAGPTYSREHEIGELPITHILFLCKANLGRSQIAEGLARKKFPEILVNSAGIYDFSETNDSPHPTVINEMRDHGIDISTHEVKQVNENMITPQTDVVVLCEPKFIPSYIIEKARTVIAIEIPDPSEPVFWGKQFSLEETVKDAYQKIYELINSRLINIIIGIRNHEYEFLKHNGINYPIRLPNIHPVDLPINFPRLIQPWETIYDYQLDFPSRWQF
jgi:protein-tyrosine-phosphatase